MSPAYKPQSYSSGSPYGGLADSERGKPWSSAHSRSV